MRRSCPYKQGWVVVCPTFQVLFQVQMSAGIKIYLPLFAPFAKHHHVIRAYNSTWGDKVTWDGTSFTATYDYNLDSSWKQEDIKFVAFLNKHNANDPLDNRIENSINVSLSATNGVEGVSTNNDAVEVARYNAAGQRIYGQQKGLNIVKLSDGRTLKVIVK